MATVELTGPHNCAECGTATPMEMAMDGDADHFTFTIEGHVIEVPGLYVCTPCTGAIMVGEKESGVTYYDAATFLAEKYIPKAAAYLARDEGDDDFTESAHRRLHQAIACAEILAMCSLMEAMEEAAEAEGVNPEDMAVMIVLEGDSHPRDMADMN